MSDPAAAFERLTKRTQPKLSERQREVLALVAMGKTHGEVGAELGMTTDGAKWHITQLRKKFNVKNTRDLVPIAHRLGLV